MNSQSLVFSTQENCRDDVADNEDEKTSIVGPRVVVGIEDGEGDKTGRATEGEEDTEDTENFLGC